MNRETSSSNAQTKKFSPPQPPEKLKSEKLPAKPLRGLSTRSSGSSGSWSTSHRFLLSHSISSSKGSSIRPVKPVVAKTPNSTPVFRKPLVRKKLNSLEETKLKSTVSEKPQRPTFGKIKGSAVKKQSSVSREVKLRVDGSAVIEAVTPVSKLGTGSDLVYRSNARDDGRLRSNSSNQEKTPPVQESVSPEMHCGTSMGLSASAQSHSCYAAGHLLSGVSDKRKCKPKGILTVCENGFKEVGKCKILNDPDEGSCGIGGSYDNNISMMPPLPADASVHWFISPPCDEEKEDDGFSRFQQIDHETHSPQSGCTKSSDLCNFTPVRNRSPMNTCKETLRRMQLSFPKCELEDSGGDKLSPLSVDTLGSDNVIQTPESNSSLDTHFRLSFSQAVIKLEVGSELKSLTTTLQSPKISPQQSSFNFDSFPTCSDSIDLSQFQRERFS